MNKKFKNFIKKIIPNSILIRKLSNNKKKRLLLSFDDGPHEHITPQVLSLLEEFNAIAIFFVVGKFVKKHPNLLSEIKEKGHIIGNHTYNHPNRRIESYSEYFSELKKTQKIIHEIIGKKPKYFRPPMGKISLKGLFATKKVKMKTILWSSEGGEWGRYQHEDAITIAKRFLRTVKHRDIILFHDNNPKIIEILNIVLPELKRKDYDLVEAINDFS